MAGDTNVRLHSSALARYAGHVRQSLNFLGHRFRAVKAAKPGSFAELYRTAVADAFNPGRLFIVTGAPHARAYYPRNFAWFYPDLLDPVTILDSDDASSRTILLARSIELICKALRQGIHTTTLVPLTKHSIVGVDYFSKPSDSLLGVLAAIRQLMYADRHHGYDEVFADASSKGKILLSEYRADLANSIKILAEKLSPYTVGDSSCLLCDAAKPYSAVTDARAEKARFVTNANIWTTFSWALELDIISRQEIEEILGRTLSEYKSELLKVFAPDGYIQHSLVEKSIQPSKRISIDFVHAYKGFWDFRNEHERKIFAETARIVLEDKRFKTKNEGLYLVSLLNPESSIVHLFTAPSYQGKAAWPAFNVEFADRLLDLSTYGGHYEEEAARILCGIRSIIERNGEPIPPGEK